ncbi:MAG TPA: PilZ domain-containing protein [Candidatus Acidoferrum sp.]|nr:PilZ domain-containing protein [Candidatus Acidoferrum sp.]
MQKIKQQERRSSRRIRIGQPLKVRPSEPRDVHFEETSTTKNVSRDGIYFLSKNKGFYEGMRLFITVPFHIPGDPLDQEYVGQVARIENLPDGNRGIAIQLLSSVGMKRPS